MTVKKIHRAVFRVSQYEMVRFGMVGVINTVVDFGSLFVLATIVGVPVFLANVLSTTTALCVSYILNKRAVFRDADMHNRRQVLLFVVVTLFGIWVLQGFVIGAVSTLLWVATNVDPVASLFIAKLTATAVSLMWNYIWYSRVVFSKKK